VSLYWPRKLDCTYCGEETAQLETKVEDNFDEELDIMLHSLWGSDTIDELEVLYRRAYYCATTPRDDKFRPEICPSTEELEWVVAELNSSKDHRRSGRLIRILEYAFRDWMTSALLHFLNGPSPALAFEVLWIFRGTEVVGEHAEYFIKLMSGQPWDHVGSCQRLAMNRVDEYLHRHSHPRLLRTLLKIYESEEYGEEVRQEALWSLGRVVGVNGLAEPEVIFRVKSRLAKEEG